MWLLNEKCAVGWASPTYKQAYKVWEQTVKAFPKDSGIVTRKDGQKLQIEFCSGSTMQFFSTERYDNIRGFTFDYLICDEFAFMAAKAWTEVLRATIIVKGKKVLLISTPNGKNHFFQLFELDGVNPQYKSFKMTSYDNPLIDPKEIDDARITLPDHIFRQEYLAEFLDGGSSIFGDIHFKESTRGNKHYGGLDIARADDYTVLSIFNERGEMVFIDRWRHDSWTNIISKVAAVIRDYNCNTFVEVNSIGDAVYEMLGKVLSNKNLIQPFVTTSKSKQDIIEQIAVANQNKEVSFLEVEWLKKEFDVFSFEYNPKTRNIKYSAPSGFHDDGVMASAIGYEALKKLKLKGVYSLE